MNIYIFSAGAIGGYIAAKLADVGADISIVSQCVV